VVFTEERILQRWELEEDGLTVFNQGAERPKHTTRHHHTWHFELQIFTNTRNLLAR
jgi:hypothetical protein